MDWRKIWCRTKNQLTLHTSNGKPSDFCKLKNTEYTKDSTFGLSIPVEIEDVPKTILNPINAWSDKEKYKAQAEDLIQRFEKNFEKFGEKVEHIAEKVVSTNKFAYY